MGLGSVHGGMQCLLRPRAKHIPARIYPPGGGSFVTSTGSCDASDCVDELADPKICRPFSITDGDTSNPIPGRSDLPVRLANERKLSLHHGWKKNSKVYYASASKISMDEGMKDWWNFLFRIVWSYCSFKPKAEPSKCTHGTWHVPRKSYIKYLETKHFASCMTRVVLIIWPLILYLVFFFFPFCQFRGSYFRPPLPPLAAPPLVNKIFFTPH